MTGSWGRPRRDGRGDLLSELQRGLRPVAPPSVLVVLWRWRWEVAIFAGLPAGITLLIARIGLPESLAMIGVLAATLALPEVRHSLGARIRCVVMAHRVRTGCAQAWIQTRSGKLPVILLTSPRSYGERVYVWCRAGISREDFEGARDVLQSACWAGEVWVSSHPRYSHIVILDVIRR